MYAVPQLFCETNYSDKPEGSLSSNLRYFQHLQFSRFQHAITLPHPTIRQFSLPTVLRSSLHSGTQRGTARLGVLPYISYKSMCRPIAPFWSTGLHFAYFGLESGMVLRELREECIYRFNSKCGVRRKEKCEFDIDRRTFLFAL